MKKTLVTLSIAYCFSLTALANTYVSDLGVLTQKVAAVNGSASPVYYDIDRDGDKDLISGSGAHKGIYIFENVGTTETPDFISPAFALLTDSNTVESVMSGSTVLPEVTDWNGDNRPDLIVSGYKQIKIFTNCTIAAGVMPLFADTGYIPALDDSTNIVIAGGNAYIRAVCYDGSSSNDLLIGERDGRKLKWYKNIGAYASPILTNMGFVTDINDIDLTFSYGPAPILFDWDYDGTNDLVVSDMTKIYVYNSTNNPPKWNLTTSFGTVPAATYYKLEPCGDINADGKPDMLLGTFTGGLFWLTNNGGAEASFSTYYPVEAPENPVDFGLTAPTVNIWDANGDGLMDISLQRTGSSIMRTYPNLGTTNLPGFNFFNIDSNDSNSRDRFYTFQSNQFKYTYYGGVLILYTNSGTYSSPNLKVRKVYPKEGADLILFSSNKTGFDVADLNADDKLDLWYYYNKTNYWFENTNDNFVPIYKERQIVTVDSNPLAFSDFRVTPEVIDWNGDGKLDVLFLRYNGQISYYENLSNFPPVLVDNGYLEVASSGVIDANHPANVFDTYDIDDNGFMDLFVGFSDSEIHRFEAIPEPVGICIIGLLECWIIVKRRTSNIKR
ncbi:VCBS repeat-containing protein [bacterium]|nr:VCBS repeat-containing protein [bacterium]